MTTKRLSKVYAKRLAPMSLGVIALAWLLLVPAMVLKETQRNWLSSDPAPSAPDYTRAAIVGIGLTVAATIIAATAERWAAMKVFGVFVTLNLAIFGFLWLLTHHPHRDRNTTPEPTHCVERSGGGNECPGD